MPQADDVLSVDGQRNGASEELNPGQSRSILQSPNGADEHARLVTVQLGLAILPPNPFGQLDVDVYCDLEWGVGKASQSVRCDILRGTALTFTATSFSVKATYRQNPHPDGPTTGPKVRVSALASYYTKPAGPLGGNARLTQRIGTLGPSQRTIDVDVPAWATHVLVLTTSISLLNGGLVNVDCKTAGMLTLYQMQPTNMYEQNNVPLANAVHKVRVTNNGSFNGDFVLLWSLGL